MWFIGFYVDHNSDVTFSVDHLKRANAGDNIWVRPIDDYIYDVTDVQFLQVDVSGEWDFSTEVPQYFTKKATEIHKIFGEIC